MEKFLETGKKFEAIFSELREQCIEYLTRMIKEHGVPNPTDGDLIIPFDTELDDEYLCIEYDGGNHPELGNICSVLYGIYLNKRDELCFATEDDNMDYTRVETIDLYATAKLVNAIIEKYRK